MTEEAKIMPIKTIGDLMESNGDPVEAVTDSIEKQVKEIFA